MGESIDVYAREQIGKLEAAHRELAADYWGPDRSNGRRSQVSEHEDRLDNLEERAAHYLDAERQETCLGLAEFALRDQETAGEDTQVKVASISMKGVVLAAAIPSTISALVTIAVILLTRR
jgi:hypothetical protein